MKEGNSNRAIDYFSLGHPLTGFRSFFALRAREKMFSLFMRYVSPTATDKVLDLGVTPDETLCESNFFEKFYPHKDKLTAASIEDCSFLEERYPGITFEQTKSGEPLPFQDNQFDILFCSAVLEHVGTRQEQKELIAECLRVSRKFFFTTPNRAFPVEFHTLIPFIHWLPQKIHQRILKGLGLEFWAKIENLNLLRAKEVYSLFPKCKSLQIYNYRLFGLPSNIIIMGERDEG